MCGIADAAVCCVGAEDEQAWIESALRRPVTAPALRVWVYRAPAIVLGCSARPDAATARRAAAAGVGLCVRPSGGGAVLAGSWLLGVSAVLPATEGVVPASIPLSFRWLGMTHAAWLGSLGIAAQPVPTRIGSDDALAWSCFAALSHWEVEAGGRKIVGLAQARRRNGVLFSGGILVAAPPWRLLCDVLDRPREHAALLAARTASCAEFLPDLPAAQALAPSLLDCLSARIASGDLGQAG